ncbi:MAG: hypothetical protein AAGI37_20295 [Planctomycetota bacterium]
MDETTSPQPVAAASASHGKSLAYIVGACVVCIGLSFGVGWLVGGPQVALASLVGAVASSAGGLVAWGLIALIAGPHTAVTAIPTLGLMIRLVVTGAGVGLAVLGLGFEQRPVLFAALFGYLVLMATETILLYRFASSDRPETRSRPAESDSEAR